MGEHADADNNRRKPGVEIEWTPGWTEAEAFEFYVAGIEGAKSEVGCANRLDRLNDKEHAAAVGAIKAVLKLAREKGL